MQTRHGQDKKMLLEVADVTRLTWAGVPGWSTSFGT